VCNPGDEVLYHEPCYVSYAPVITFAFGKAVAVPTTREGGFRLEREALESRATDRTKALLLNFPANPTGTALSREDVESICAFARERDLLVVSDEIYSELTYDMERASPAAAPGMKERTIFLHGFSKAWAMTGFRMGYACAPAELIEAMMKIHQYTMLCAPILSQEAAVEALNDPEPVIEAMRSEYHKRRNFIHGSLNEMGLPCHKPSGAFYAFPYVGDYGMTSKEFAFNLLEEEQVACVPGDAFGPSGEGFLRCSYATDFEQIKEAMARMAAFVERLNR
jgi:aminotransferase